MSLKDLWKSFISNDPVGNALKTKQSSAPAPGEDPPAYETEKDQKRRQDDEAFGQSGFPGAM